MSRRAVLVPGRARRVKFTFFPPDAGFLVVPLRAGESARPVEAYITAGTEGGSDTIVDVLWSDDPYTVAPGSRVWESIFPAGNANKCVLPANQERRENPISQFVAPIPAMLRYALLKTNVIQDSAADVVVVVVVEVV